MQDVVPVVLAYMTGFGGIAQLGWRASCKVGVSSLLKLAAADIAHWETRVGLGGSDILAIAHGRMAREACRVLGEQVDLGSRHSLFGCN